MDIGFEDGNSPYLAECQIDVNVALIEQNTPATVPDTSTKTSASTATGTSTSVAATVAAETEAEARLRLQKIADASSGQQSESLANSVSVNQLGANYAATIGSLYCAEGANAAVKDPSAGGPEFRACKDYFSSANALNRNASGLHPDELVTGKEGSKTILAEFSQNFGVTGDDYLKRMLSSGGSRSELGDLLSTRLTSANLDETFARAEKAESGGQFTLNLQGAGRKPSSSLRDILKKKLAEPESQPVQAALVPNVKHEEADHLEPLQNSELLFGGKEQEPELTLFDVVRRKYRELSRRYSLVPGRRP
ncbi:MAG: hypothetical protein ACXVB9_17975 [Bdellovibrionota bacterium]